MSEAHRLAERLNKLVILDEVGSNNPLAKDAAALLLRQETLIERQRELLERALEALENSHYDVGSEEKQRLGVMDAITAIHALKGKQ